MFLFGCNVGFRTQGHGFRAIILGLGCMARGLGWSTFHIKRENGAGCPLPKLFWFSYACRFELQSIDVQRGRPLQRIFHCHIVPLKQTECGVYGDLIMILGSSIFYELQGDYGIKQFSPETAQLTPEGQTIATLPSRWHASLPGRQ